jgi:hypothetical protein
MGPHARQASNSSSTRGWKNLMTFRCSQSSLALINNKASNTLTLNHVFQSTGLHKHLHRLQILKASDIILHFGSGSHGVIIITTRTLLVTARSSQVSHFLHIRSLSHGCACTQQEPEAVRDSLLCREILTNSQEM